MGQITCRTCQRVLPAGVGCCPLCNPAREGEVKVIVDQTVGNLAGKAVGVQIGDDAKHKEMSVTSSQAVDKVEAGGRAVGAEINIGNLLGTLVVDSGRGLAAQTAQDERLRRLLLDRVNEVWIEGMLLKELRGAQIEVRGRLLKHAPREEDFSEAEAVQPAAEGGDLTLPENVRDVLLILGRPGSGKTISLLKLARGLIERAENDPTQSVPVVLNLSTWGVKKSRSFKDWLIAELTAQYIIPAKVLSEWMDRYSLTFLLDGLEEVGKEYREGCVEAINEFLKESIGFMAVSCRTDEYAELKGRLRAGATMFLHPLSTGDIGQYVEAVGLRADHFMDTIGKSEALKELATSPLMLGIMTKLHGGMLTGLPAGSASTEDYQARIFTDYVEGAFQPRTVGKGLVPRVENPPATRERTVGELVWLARRLREHSATVFRMEQMQPSWLGAGWQLWAYALVTRMLAATAVGLSFCPLFWDASGFGLYVVAPCMAGGLASGVLAGMSLNKSLRRSDAGDTRAAGIGRRILKGLLHGAAVWVVASLLATFVMLLSVQTVLLDVTRAEREVVVAVFMLLGVGVGYVLFAAVLGALFGFREWSGTAQGDIIIKTVGWSWKASIRGLLVGAVGAFVISSAALALMLIPVLLKGVKVDASDGLMFILLIGVFLGQLIIPLVTVISGLRGDSLEMSLGVNRGVWRMGKNALISGLAISAVSGVLFYLLRRMPGPQQGLLEQVFSTGFFFIPPLAVSLGLYIGGLAFIEHFVLRLLLFIGGRVPWDYARFLDYAAELVFMRKVGGGYIFIHNSLRDFFADGSDAGPTRD